MSTSIVAISLHSLLAAEAQIAGCANCTDQVHATFEQVLETATGHLESAMFVLPMPALCPMCQSPVFEWTMVQFRAYADLALEDELDTKSEDQSL